MATVSRHTFTCDTCGKEEILQFSNDEPKHMPEGWLVKRLRKPQVKVGKKNDEFVIPPAYHYCSVECRDGVAEAKPKKPRAKKVTQPDFVAPEEVPVS